MQLSTVWFILIGFLFAGYAILDGFDLGAGHGAARQGLQAEFAEDERVATLGLAGKAAFLLLAEFGAGGCESHGSDC